MALKILKNKWFIIALIFVSFATAATLFLNHFFLPIHVKNLIAQKLQEQLKRPVSIEAFHFNPFKGFYLKKIVIREPKGETTFAQIDAIHFGFLYLPIIKNKEIVLPFVKIHQPSIHITHKDDAWNFQDLLTPEQKKDTKESTPSSVSNIAITKLEIINLNIHLIDNDQQPVLKEAFENIQLEASLKNLNQVKFDLAGDVQTSKGRFTTNGNITIASREVKADIHLRNINFPQYLPLLGQALPVIWSKGLVRDFKGTLTIDKNHTKFIGYAALDDQDIALNEQAHMKGNIILNDIDVELNKNILRLKGIVNTEDLALEYDDYKITGSSQLFINDLRKNDDKLTLNAALALNDAHIHSPSFDLKGNFSTKKTELKMKDNTTQVTTDLDILKTDLKAQQTLSVTGDAHMKEASLLIEKNSSRIISDVNWRDLKIQTPDLTATGHLTIDKMDVSQSNQGLIINTQGVLNEAHIKTQDADVQSQTITFAKTHTTLDKDQKIIVKSALQLNDAQVMLSEKQKMSGHIHLTDLMLIKDGKQLKITTPFSTERVSAQVNDMHYEGRPQGQLDIALDPGLMPALNYTAQVTLTNSLANGLPQLGMVKNIKGHMDVTPTEITIKDLSFETLGSTFTTSGELNNFKDPSLNITLSSPEIDLAKASALAKDVVAQHGLTLKGTSSLQLAYKGPISNWQEADFKASSLLKDVHINSAQLKRSINTLNGKLEATPLKVLFSDLNFVMDERPFEISGEFNRSGVPFLKADVVSNGITVDALFGIRRRNILLDKVVLNYRNSQWITQGKVNIENAPYLDITTMGTANLEDLPFLAKEFEQTIPDTGMKGMLNHKVHVTGPASKWKEWIINFEGQSPRLTMQGLDLENAKIAATHKEQQLNPIVLTGNFYSGLFESTSSLDLSKTHLPFQTALKISNIDIAQAKKHTPLKIHNIAGALSLTTVANGNLPDQASYVGNGTIKINNGYLWSMEAVTIKEAHANFTIQDQKIMTEGMELTSDYMTFRGQGHVTFDQHVDFNVVMDVNTANLVDSGNFPIELLPAVQGFQSAHFSGKIPHIKAKYDINPAKAIKETLKDTLGSTGEAILDGVGGLLDLF